MESWDQWCRRHSSRIGSDDYGYEALFAWQVLPRISGLNPENVTPQLEVPLDGRRRRIDFAIRKQGVKLAVEIDGWDKSGTGTGMSREQHQDFLARQNALVLAGWTVIRFTPADIRDRPAQVAERLENALAKSARVTPAPTPAATAAPSTARAWVGASPGTSPAPDPATPAHASGGHTASSSGKWIAGAVAAALAIGTYVFVNQSTGFTPNPPGESISCSGFGVVRGNINQTGERIYHMPGDAYYDATNPEQCFDSAAAAEAAGYRRSKV